MLLETNLKAGVLSHTFVLTGDGIKVVSLMLGPVYVGTGCIFRRIAFYGFDPSRLSQPGCCYNLCCCCAGKKKKKMKKTKFQKRKSEVTRLTKYTTSDKDDDIEATMLPKPLQPQEVTPHRSATAHQGHPRRPQRHC